MNDEATVDSPYPAAGGSPPDRTLVIDVRSAREFDAAALHGALNIPLPDLQGRIGRVAADRAVPLVLYCASGARSGIGCVMLAQMGYTNVSNAGGLLAAAARLQRNLR